MTSQNDTRVQLLAALLEDAKTQGVEIRTLKSIVAEASEEGAMRALKQLGLQDEDAGHDIRELRNLLDAWRDARRTALRTFVKWMTAATILGLVAGLALKMKLPFGS